MMHDSVEELFVEAAKPTEYREPQASVKNEYTSDPLPPKEVPKAPEATDEPEEQIELSPEMIASSADMSIAMADLIQNGFFSFIIDRKKNSKLVRLYGEEAIDKLERLINEQDAEKNNKLSQTILREFTADENGMLRLAREVHELLKEIPFTEKEKEAIKIPLMALMKEKGGHLSPSWLLAFAVLQVFGSRAMSTYQL